MKEISLKYFLGIVIPDNSSPWLVLELWSSFQMAKQEDTS